MTHRDIEYREWLNKEGFRLSTKHLNLARRYAYRYAEKFGYPIGRPLALFMMWFNRKHAKKEFFSNKAINYWYVY